ncbi:MAG: hypothetical protein HS114_34495 [Anaerolineales bacterium]|nr:hypothetical protein [Anaerolineales bacterium]
MNNYPHPRPTEPVQLYLLAGLAGFGLLALWLAAFHAFLNVASGPQAFFAATLIEAGLIIEALALIKRPHVWYTWVAMAISLMVSGTYNYIQAAAVAGESLNTWMLLTLALGPLAALAFVSLTLGHELREYQNRVESWQADKAAWLEQRRLEAEAYERQQEAERQARLERLQQAEYERQEREAQRRYEAERVEREWQHKQQERAERRTERLVKLKDQPEYPPEPLAPVTPLLERSSELDAFLAIIRERAGEQPYSPEDVQKWTGQRRTKAFEILKYGRQFGDVQQVRKGQYVNNGRHE